MNVQMLKTCGVMRRVSSTKTLMLLFALTPVVIVRSDFHTLDPGIPILSLILAILCTEVGSARLAPRSRSCTVATSSSIGALSMLVEFILEMVRNHLQMEPHFMGVASDGLRACTNFALDDNISCVYKGSAKNAPCTPISDGFTAWVSFARALLVYVRRVFVAPNQCLTASIVGCAVRSRKASLMNEVGPLLHQNGADKLFSANTINGPRIHLLRHVDLVITEQLASEAGMLAANAWLGLLKPIVMWTTTTEPGLTTVAAAVKASLTVPLTEQADVFFQRMLHLGVFPMPPMPSADHSIQNGSLVVHEQFLDYGSLFKALQGRSWVLRPYAVEGSVVSAGASSASTGTVASLASSNNSDVAQLWRNVTFAAGECPGALESLSASSAGQCLVVYNPEFSPSACAGSVEASQLWIYPCPSPSPLVPLTRPPETRLDSVSDLTTLMLGDCPLHENIRWKFTSSSQGAVGRLRSAVPMSMASNITWELCLASTGEISGRRADSAKPLGLAPCNESPNATRQQWEIVPSPFVGAAFQICQTGIGDNTKCVSSNEALRPPLVNLFRDERAFALGSGVEILVITSDGPLLPNGTQVEAVLRCPQPGDDPTIETPLFCSDSKTGLQHPSAFSGERLNFNFTISHPGDRAWSPVPPEAIRRLPDQSLSVTVSLIRGAAVVRLSVRSTTT